MFAPLADQLRVFARRPASWSHGLTKPKSVDDYVAISAVQQQFEDTGM
jgi:hypothetical protein